MFIPTRVLLLTFVLTFIIIIIVNLAPDSTPSFWSGASETYWPNKIWQTWKFSITDLSEEDSTRVRTWLDHNPNYRHELLTDASAEAFVHLHFDREPLIKDTFFALTDKILRADFLRYLVLLGEGGVSLRLKVILGTCADSTFLNRSTPISIPRASLPSPLGSPKLSKFHKKATAPLWALKTTGLPRRTIGKYTPTIHRTYSG